MGKLRVLFQGDSITDMGRDRGDIRNMGSGYPLFVEFPRGETELRYRLF